MDRIVGFRFGEPRNRRLHLDHTGRLIGSQSEDRTNGGLNRREELSRRTRLRDRIYRLGTAGLWTSAGPVLATVLSQLVDYATQGPGRKPLTTRA